MEYTFDSTIVSDLYKDAYGFRPGSDWMKMWKIQSDMEKQYIWEQLCSDLDRAVTAQREAESRAYDVWMNRILYLKETNNITIADAIRWDMQAMDCVGDVGFYCYELGLAFSVEEEIKQKLEIPA